MVDGMFHLRRIHFHSYVTAAAAKAAEAQPLKSKVAAAKTPAEEPINDKIEPTSNPALRSMSTFILLDKVTKIGRNPELVDVVLNSVMHSNMISRDHSELLGELDENQQCYSYKIYDKSLNGTYVNDTRVTGAIPLQEGDIIKFGHVNGAAIKPGEYAPQQTAEFIFRFERAIPDYTYFGYTSKGVRLHPEKTRAYMQISSDRVDPHEAFPATSVTKVLPHPTIASANATVAAVVSLSKEHLPASTSTSLSSSTSSTSGGLNSLMSGLSSGTTSLHTTPLTMQQHQHAAAASALAAAANLSADDVAAVSAHLRTVAAADALNSWNSSLYQLTRLHQQNPHLYGSAFPAAAAAAAAYFQGAAGTPAAAALWPNVAQWRAALGQGAATASNSPTDWVQFNQQKAAVAAAYAAANSASSANSLQHHLRLPYSQPLQQNTGGLPAPLPLGPQATSTANCLPTSSNSGFLPQILSPCAMGNPAGGGYGGVITSANATSSIGTSVYGSSFGCSAAASNSNSAYSSCTSAAGPIRSAQQQQRESPSISAKLAVAAAVATKESFNQELEAATRAAAAAAAWPSITCSSGSTSSTRTQLPPSLASVLPAALAARQAGVPLSYMANPSSLSIGQRIPIATALAAVTNNMNGGPPPSSANQQNTSTPNSKLTAATTSQQVDWCSSGAAADAFLGSEERRLLGSPPTANLSSPPPLPIKLDHRSRNSSTSLSSISSQSTSTNRAPTNNLVQTGGSHPAEVTTEELLSKASCSSVTDPTPTATTINSLAAAIFDHEGGVVAGKGSRRGAPVQLTPQKPVSNKKTMKRIKTADLDQLKADLNGEDLRQLQMAAVTAASLVSEGMERPDFVRTPDAAGAEVLPPSSIVVCKMMECDSSVPSPPKANTLLNVGGTNAQHNGQHNDGHAPDSVASNPSRPCSYQSSIPLSPPRAPCPQRRKSPESASHSPLPESKKYCSSDDSRASWNRREEKEELVRRAAKKKKTKNTKNQDEQEQEEEEEAGEKPKPIKHSRKSNEVARLLNDLTAGNCSWQHQAERTIRSSSKHSSTTNGTSGHADTANGTLGVGSTERKRRTLRLEERKLKEMQKKKQHKMMRQISDESSEDSDAGDSSHKKQLAALGSEKRSSASYNDSDSDASSVKDHRNNLLSSAPRAKSKRMAAAAEATNGTDPSPPTFKSDTLVKKRLTSMHVNELRNAVGGNSSSTSLTKAGRTSTQEKRRILKESVKEENSYKSSSQSKTRGNSSTRSKKSDKSSSLSSRPTKRKSSSKSRKKAVDSDSDSDTDSMSGNTEAAETMKPPASKRSNGSNGSGSKNNSLDTSSSSAKKRNSTKINSSVKERGQKTREGIDNDEWFLYHDPDRDLCAHKACQRPQQLSINWVQCDDCDSWYHSVCATGSNSELEGDADFHCGCLLRRK